MCYIISPLYPSLFAGYRTTALMFSLLSMKLSVTSYFLEEQSPSLVPYLQQVKVCHCHYPHFGTRRKH